MIGRLLDRLVPWLERHVPHDTLMIGGRPYMHRWYLFGYAPTPDDPDARMICATCRLDVQELPDWHGEDGATWVHVGHGAAIQNVDHVAVPISAPREGWWWNDHGIGAVRLHKIVASDDSRAFHDHPWPFLALGLSGSYVEIVPAPGSVVYGTDGLGNAHIADCPTPHGGDWSNATSFGYSGVRHRRYRAPFVNVKRAEDLHVLEIEGGPVWTLFLTRPKQRSWGFAGPFGWLPWRQFDEQFPEREAWTDTTGTVSW